MYEVINHTLKPHAAIPLGPDHTLKTILRLGLDHTLKTRYLGLDHKLKTIL